MFPLPTHKACRRGVTMIELLVVVGILVMLAAISIPAFRAAPEGRAVREATRGGNVYFGNARHRAMETGRPCGVLLERLPRHPHACVVLRQVEVPPPFAGYEPGAVLRAVGGEWVGPDGNTYLRVQVRGTTGMPVDFANRLIRHGDLIQLNHQGPWYSIVDYAFDNTPAGMGFPAASDYGSDFPPINAGSSDPNPDPNVDPAKQYVDFAEGRDDNNDGWMDSHSLVLCVNTSGVIDIPWGAGAQLPFKILRQPVPTSVKPLELSGGAVIDLAASGFDRPLPDSGAAEVARTFEPDTPGDPSAGIPPDLRPVIVMFSPNGSVEGVYYSQRVYSGGAFSRCEYAGRRLIEPIHFLVGKWERLPVSLRKVNVAVPDSMAMHPSLAEDGVFNRQDAGNLWLTLNPQTGLATVAELHADLPPGGGHPTMYVPSGATLAEQLIVSRRFAREAQISKGGR